MYKIGQVLYIISSSTKAIEPVQVHSKQTLESWEGTTVQHMCSTVDEKIISLEDHGKKGLIAGAFETVEEAQAHLLKLAANMVASLAVKAREQARVFEKPVSEDQELPVPEEEPSQNEELPEQILSEPTSEQPLVSQSRPRTPRGVQMITLPDGTRARVHLPADMQ